MVRTLLILLPLLIVNAPSATAQARPLPGGLPIPTAVQARIDSALATSPSRKSPRTRHRAPDGSPLYTNRLVLEKSPYLLQHAHNPVNWFPWGEEAFETARRLKRPLLLSVGYSTCHWCHVMEEESFEDPEIAEFMNRHYIAIKVDREARPDIDEIYMTAIQALTGGGGWPMTVWLTPDREPFFGGTYFPPRAGMHGRPGFLDILKRMSDLYGEQHERIVTSAAALVKVVQETLSPKPSIGVPAASDIQKAIHSYQSRFDAANGGIRSRTKFPSSLPISLLLRVYRRTGDESLLQMARQTLEAMRRGGIHDQVGGGFHRYSTEPTWTVPHFEKMLYDNALLALAYLDAYQVAGEAAWGDVVRDILTYVSREMTSPEGTFYTASDADSEGEEGRFFVWTRPQLERTVGAALTPLAVSAYGLEGAPNFEGKSYVLRRDASAEQLARVHGMKPQQVETALSQIRTKMREIRAHRIPPLMDDKQLISWNGLMISAFARAGAALREPDLIERGARAARFLLQHARPQGRLARYVREGAPHERGMLDDHAFLEGALLDLFEATHESHWLSSAIELQKQLDTHFFDEKSGGYWVSSTDGEALLVREKPAQDGALPSGNSWAVMNLLRLYTWTLDADYRIRAEMTLRAFADRIHESPTGYARMLEALDFLLDRPKEIVIVTPEGIQAAEPFLRELGQVYLPNRVLVVTGVDQINTLKSQIPWVESKKPIGGETTAYVCENRVCDLPARKLETFARQIRKKAARY